MSAIKFFLSTPNEELSSIVAIIHYEKLRFKKGIKYTIPTKFWDHEQQKILTKNYREAQQINFELKAIKSAAERVFIKLAQSGVKTITQSELWEKLEAEKLGIPYAIKSNKQLFLKDYVAEIFIPRYEQQMSLQRLARFEAFVRLWSDFEIYSNKMFSFDHITIATYKQFELWMSSVRKYSINYIGTQIKLLKQVMREAQQVDNLHQNEQYLSTAFKIVSEEVDNVYLTVGEIERLHRLVIDDDFIDKVNPRSISFGRESLKKSYTLVKNKFIIGCYTGLRVSDFNRLSGENIDGDKIRIVAQKTEQPIVIPISSTIREILDSGFDLSQHISEQKMRAYIRDLCREAGITDTVEVRRNVSGQRTVIRLPKWELVSTHTARRSFATNAYKAGVPALAICKLTGHTTERALIKYIKIGKEENADLLAKHPFFR